MKIAFIGGIEFSHALLSEILKKNFDVKIVFSYDESKKKYFSDFASFDSITKKYGVFHKKVRNINDPENLELLKKIHPDLIFVMGWSQILKSEILNIPKIGVIGSHPTELPKFRGRAPIPWSILKGLKQSALTFFYIDEGVDNGDILDQEKFIISETDDANSLYKKITKIGQKMLIKNLENLQNNCSKRIKQDETKFIENWPKRTPDDGLIDWSKTSEEIHRLIRASTHPYPGAFTFYKKSKLIIWNASTNNVHSKPGMISKISDDGVEIGTSSGNIILKLVSIGNSDKELCPSKIFSETDIGLQIINGN